MIKYIILIVLLIGFVTSCDRGLQDDNIQYSELSDEDNLLFQSLIDSLNINYIDDNDKLIILSDQIVVKFPNYSANGNMRIAHLHFFKENYYLSEYYFAISANEFYANNMMVEYAEQLSNIGVVREVSGSYPEALEKYFEALEIFESLDMKLKTARIFNNIGIVYQQLGECDKSLEYYRKSLQISKEVEGGLIINANTKNNIATHFEEFVHDYDSALYYYEQAQIIYENEDMLRQLYIVDNNIGNIYQLKNELEIADSIFITVLEKSIEFGFDKTIAPILNNQAELFCRQNRYIDAVKKAEQASVLADEIANRELKVESINILYELYEKLGDFKKANEMLHEKYTIQEQLSGIEQKKQISLLNIKYEVDKKENRIEILELNSNVQQREIFQLYLIIAIVVLLFAGVFMTFVLYRKNNKLINAQMQSDIVSYIDTINQITKDNKSQLSEQTKCREIQIIEIVKSFNLTEREKDVLLLLSKGYNNTKIAGEIFVSVNTVKYHTKNIFIKLDVKNRMEAVQKAQGL